MITIIKFFIYDQNLMSMIKNHNKIKLASDKNQNKTI